MNNPKHRILFEGAELSGKSFLMSKIFLFLEKKYYSGGKTMDGCHWINCDIGILGTKYGETMLIKYLELIEKLKEANIIIEKFHLTEAVYQKLYYQRDFDFNKIDNRLKKINAKIILSTFDEDAALLKHRLRDRLKHYPHYQKIAQQPRDYIEQQKLYLKLLESSQLEHLIVNTSKLPDQKIIDDILHFLKEK